MIDSLVEFWSDSWNEGLRHSIGFGIAMKNLKVIAACAMILQRDILQHHDVLLCNNIRVVAQNWKLKESLPMI